MNMIKAHMNNKLINKTDTLLTILITKCIYIIYTEYIYIGYNSKKKYMNKNKHTGIKQF